MSDEQFSYSQAKARLDEIVLEVRKKDISLEKSLELLEEGVSLANKCTELIDEADWDAAKQGDTPDEAGDASQPVIEEDAILTTEAEFDGDSNTDESAAE